MALVRVAAEGGSASASVTIAEFAAVRDALGALGIDYERWEPAHPLARGRARGGGAGRVRAPRSTA